MLVIWSSRSGVDIGREFYIVDADIRTLAGTVSDYLHMWNDEVSAVYLIKKVILNILISSACGSVLVQMLYVVI